MMMKPLIVMLLMLDLCQLLDAFSAVTTATSSYLQTVTQWLDQENIAWKMDPDHTFLPQTHQPVLRVSVEDSSPTTTTSTFLYLHLLKSPTSSSDCVSPTCARDMTNYAQHNNSVKLIHLHEDVFHSKTDIVKSRLRMRLNLLRRSSRRVFARKTVARRIDAATAIPFLHEHHLWSATKARFYYGLFLPSQSNNDDGDVLVAVATFSSSRKIVGLRENTTSTRCHELLRFCARRDGVVVGGITKLIRAFVQGQKPSSDDNDLSMCIVTAIDRDWGPGHGWNSIGFQTLHVMAPVVMLVGGAEAKDDIPVRRHLVGAGIQNPTDHTKPNGSGSSGRTRPGLEKHLLDKLDNTHTYQDSIKCLEEHNYYPVYDAGVERLLLIIPKEQPQIGKKTSQTSALESALWKTSVPSYAPAYYSKNKGISALLNHVMALAITGSSTYGLPSSERNANLTLNTITTGVNVNDSLQARGHTAGWMATRGTARNATLLYTAPSSMDSHALVQVRERPGGWCTLGIVGGATKSIYHGNFKLVDGHGTAIGSGMRCIDSSVLVSEYLRSMAAVALAALEFRKAHPDTCTCSDPDICGADEDKKAKLSFLYLGYGAGSLPRFMASTIPESRHIAIELDDGVVSAAHHCHLLGQPLSTDTEICQVQLQLGDALGYQRPTTTATTTATGPDTRGEQESFDVVFVDIFDGDNLLPKEFYSKSFLEHIQQNLLGGRSDGMVIHNFHSGGKARRAQLEDATKAYRGVFSTTLAVESLDSRQSGGNTILLAMNNRRLDASSETLSWHIAGKKAQNLWGVNFDVCARSTHKMWLS